MEKITHTYNKSQEWNSNSCLPTYLESGALDRSATLTDISIFESQYYNSKTLLYEQFTDNERDHCLHHYR